MSAVREVFRANPIPVPEAKVDLVYHPTLLEDGVVIPDFWTVRLYRDNLRTFNGVDQLAIMARAKEIVVKCRQAHPRVYLEAWKTETEPE